MSSLTRDVALVGVGYSELSRQGTPDPRKLTFTAVTEALQDAGLNGNQVDGIFEYKFGPESPSAQEVARLIGAPNLTAFADIIPNNPSGLAGPLMGVMAVASGVCETVVAFRCLTRAAGYTGGVRTGPDRIPGRDQFLLPYGYSGGIIMNMALAKQRWMGQYGRGEEDFGHIAVNARKWAARNPRAVLREEITMDDYLESRIISDPLRLLDCDYPINGAVATIITTAERARDLGKPPSSSTPCPTAPAQKWTGSSARTTSTAARSPAPRPSGTGQATDRRTSTWPRSTTASPASPCSGSRRSASAASASSATGSGTAAASAPAATCP